MPRPRTIPAALIATAALLLLMTATAGADGVDAQAARSCSVPNYPGSGYFTSLVGQGTSCATGRKVALPTTAAAPARGARAAVTTRAPLLLP